ncbi:hypothetical protein L0128_12125 [candidate division KSB1 bacterium]|nr:hypothetical protein [candidate division KSB1 bacterium]
MFRFCNFFPPSDATQFPRPDYVCQTQTSFLKGGVALNFAPAIRLGRLTPPGGCKSKNPTQISPPDANELFPWKHRWQQTSL